MAAIHKTACALVALALLVGVSGCYSPSGVARADATAAANTELRELKSKANDLADQKSLNAFADAVREGGLGVVLPSPIPRSLPFPAPDGFRPYEISAAGELARIDFVVWGDGESGGGFTGDQAGVYLCLALTVTATVPHSAVLAGTSCRHDVTELMDGGQGKSLITFAQSSQ